MVRSPPTLQRTKVSINLSASFAIPSALRCTSTGTATDNISSLPSATRKTFTHLSLESGPRPLRWSARLFVRAQMTTRRILLDLAVLSYTSLLVLLLIMFIVSEEPSSRILLSSAILVRMVSFFHLSRFDRMLRSSGRVRRCCCRCWMRRSLMERVLLFTRDRLRWGMNLCFLYIVEKPIEVAEDAQTLHSFAVELYSHSEIRSLQMALSHELSCLIIQLYVYGVYHSLESLPGAKLLPPIASTILSTVFKIQCPPSSLAKYCTASSLSPS